MERVFLTGATGFVGANLLRKFVELNKYEVHILLRDSSDTWRINDLLDGKNVIMHKGDLSNLVSLRKLLDEVLPDHILHLATYGAYPTAQTDEELTIKTNLLGTMNLINASLDIEYKSFINTGSSSEYGFKKKPMSEEDVAEPMNLYGISKLAAANYAMMVAKTKNKNIVHVRLFSVYGYYEEPIRLVPSLMRNIILHEDMDLTSGIQTRDFIFIEDVVEGFLKLMSSGELLRGNILNLGTGIKTSIKEFCNLSIKCNKSDITLNFGSIDTRHNETFDWVADITKMHDLLKWVPKISLSEGIKKTLDWFKEHYDAIPWEKKYEAGFKQ